MVELDFDGWVKIDYPAARYIRIVTNDTNVEIPNIKEYNIYTKEAILFKMSSEDPNKVEIKWKNEKYPSLFPFYEGQPSTEYGREIVTEKVTLHNSKIAFVKDK